MTPEDVLQFHNLVYSYRDAAYKYGLWTAAGILMETGCSDDSFSDFRMWLIAQGKDVYLNALKDPDSLSGVTPYGYCSFEACLLYTSVFALSGGEKQKIACASSSVLLPGIMVLDEPSSNLDMAAIDDLRQVQMCIRDR